ncbi:MAG: LD-carboxypeptidase [Ectothiorhodospiraceae bacterium]|nr:LD-carboxypeptidase [Ectothiorhodospiraceae bacterium]
MPIIPQPLHPGGTIGVVAPGSPPVDDDYIIAGVQYLERKGYKVQLGESVMARDGYLSGDDDLRAADINAMFADDSVQAVFCTRGGYGCTRILPLLDYALIHENPKPLLGFSDVTAMHAALYTEADLISYGGPMVAVEMRQPMQAGTEQTLWSMVGSAWNDVEIGLPPAHEGVYEREGTASGRLFGGNLAVLTSLVGTLYFPDIDGGILFFEEIGENVYRIDRMLSQLRNADVLEGLAGVLIGTMTGVPEDKVNRPLEKVFEEYFAPLEIPVMTGFPFGHIPEKITYPHGAYAEMDASTRIVRFKRGE